MNTNIRSAVNRYKVWFIDDEPTQTVHHFVKALQVAGIYAIRVFERHEDAVAEVAKGVLPDLVVIDMMMKTEDPTFRARTMGGRYSGAAVLRQFRQGATLVPAILLSQLSIAELCEVAWDEFVSWRSERNQSVPTGDRTVILEDIFRIELVNKNGEAPFLFEQRVRRILTGLAY